ncbi:hypothetical protein [Streptomyces luteolifulvus]|uniref:hypothetical protein n=1 Tax=Streptomyces luteolifulvus TaxID=2615112 RepID=UPI00178382A2|nr:hypothetical protein [Streptomyces luteolifulvus]
MMRILFFGALLGLLWVLFPALLSLAAGLLVGLAANTVVVGFGLGFVLRPAITRRWAS